jgi:YidC/Oxa1 family membrane protein insertase
MIGIEAWQTILNGLGWIIARLYDIVGQRYGVAIILLTVAVRLLLLPLGIKQIRSMHQMQQIQPKVKELQKKYKGNKQKISEETMKLYSEYGVSPLSSCMPLLLQLPVMFALISVLRPPVPVPPPANPTHFPDHSHLEQAVVTNDFPHSFLGMNLQCTPLDAGNPEAPVLDKNKKQVDTLDCGQDNLLTKFPYYLLIALMAATSWYQQRQMQKAAPPGAAQQQQKAMQFLPLIFVFLFIRYPVGLTLYWTTTNVWQIGQQHFLLSALKKDQEAAKAGLPPKKAPKDAGDKPSKPAKKGFMARAVEQAEQERTRKTGETKGQGAKGSSGSKGTGQPSKKPQSPSKPTGKGGGQQGRGSGQSNKPNPPKKKPGSGSGSGGSASDDQSG